MKMINSALYSRLQGTAITSLLSGTTAIYSLQAPEGAVLPYIVYNVQGGGDENQSQNRTKNLVVFVRAYAAQNSTAGSIDAQIDSALHLSPLTVSGWANFWMARETDLETVENPPTGGQIFMNGALYRCRLDQN